MGGKREFEIGSLKFSIHEWKVRSLYIPKVLIFRTVLWINGFATYLQSTHMIHGFAFQFGVKLVRRKIISINDFLTSFSDLMIVGQIEKLVSNAIVLD